MSKNFNEAYNEFIKSNKANPFNQDKIVICSYQYAAKMYHDLISPLTNLNSRLSLLYLCQ